jgi:hypothetical protein
MTLSLGSISCGSVLRAAGGEKVTLESVVRRALSEAEATQDPTERAEALLRLAKAQLARHELAAARSTLRWARDAARAIKPDANPTIPHPIIRVAQAQEQAAQHLAARQTFGMAVRMIQAENLDRQVQDWVNLLPIQRDAIGRRGMAETFQAYLNYIEAMPQGIHALADASLVYRKIGAGNIDSALQMIRDSSRDTAANRANDQIQNLFELLYIVDRGEAQAAKPLLEEARKLIDGLDAFNRCMRLGTLAEIEARLGLFEEAIAYALAIDTGGIPGFDMANSLEFQKAQAFLEIAERQAKAGANDGARSTALRALNVVDPLRSEAHRAYPLQQAAQVLIDVGDFEGAGRAYASCRSPYHRFLILRCIGEAQAKRADHGGAEVLQKALAQAREFFKRANESREGARDKDELPLNLGSTDLWLREIACIQARLGDMPGALRIIESSTDNNTRDQAIAQLAADRADVGDFKSVGTLLGKIKSPQIKRRALIAVACAPVARDNL